MVFVIIEFFKILKFFGFDNINVLVVKLIFKVIVVLLIELIYVCICKGVVLMVWKFV